jgi:hypothetical protein
VNVFIMLVPAALLVWALHRWWVASPRIGVPALRYHVALVAIGLGGVSTLLWLTSLVWAQAIGGLQVYDPVLMWFVRLGFLTAPLGFLTSFLGKGTLRWPSCGLSGLMTFLWLAAALGT